MNSANNHDPKGDKVSKKGSKPNSNQWNGGKGRNCPKGKSNSKAKSGQPRKDSGTKRVNFDNAREDKVGKRIIEDAKSGKFNDINDFLKNPVLVQAAASVPVAPILGKNVGYLGPVPGIMMFNWRPNFGSFEPGGSIVYDTASTGNKQRYSQPPFAINQAADTMYSFLVHANSRNYAYNSADLFMLIMAGSQVFSAIEAMKRAYGLIKRYVEYSDYMPDSELRMMGFDPIDMRKNFSHMWFDINLLISQTRQIWIPTTLPFVSRWMDMNSNIYKDAEGPYAQEYIFVQTCYYQYSELMAKTGGSLKVAQYPETDSQGNVTYTDFYVGRAAAGVLTIHKWSEWVGMVQTMIGHLINSEDRGIIYGDLLNAFGADRIMAIPEIASDYSIDAEYSPEISMQIENMVTYQQILYDGWTQIENRIVPYVTQPEITPTQRALVPDNWSLNFHTTTAPTPEMMLLATRFATLGVRAAAVPLLQADGSFLPTPKWIPETMGSEVIENVYVATEPLHNASTLVKQWSQKGANQDIDMSCMAFDWHPFKAVVGTGSITKATQDQADAGSHLAGNIVTATYGDYDRYAEMDWKEVKRINDVAFLSLYDVPSSIA